MRPVYLEMNYFGPHEHSIIDFRKLNKSAIFLIGGDTGAGKSTIFDAMTFALFGSTTSERNAKEMRSQFASGTQVTKIIFYFEQNGKIYKIERTPTQQLAKKKGNGFTTNNATANLSIVDDVNGVEIDSLAALPRDVGNLIEKDILRLSADQFKKIILLPQNDFSEFLKSDTADKEKILKKIFGTQIFTDFTTQLKIKYDQVIKKGTGYTQELNNQFTSTVWNEEEQKALSEATDDEKNILLNKILAKRENISLAAKKNENEISKNWQKAYDSLQHAKDIQKLFDDLTDNQNKYQTQIRDQEETIQHQTKHVAELTWAQKSKDTIRDLENARKDYSVIEQNKKNVLKTLEKDQTNFEDAQSQFNKLADQKDEFVHKEQQSTDLIALITKVKHTEELQKQIQSLTPQSTKIGQQVADKNSIIENLQQSIESKNKLNSDTDKLQKRKDNLILEKESAFDVLSPLETNYLNIQKAIQKTEQDLAELDQKFKSENINLKNAEVDFGAKKSNRQSLMIAQLQSELVTGAPCPVCGSVEHPYAVELVPADEDKLRQAIEDVDESQKLFAKANSSVQNIQQDIDETTASLQNQKEQLAIAKQTLFNNYQIICQKSSITLPTNFDTEAIKKAFKTNINHINSKIESSLKISQEIKQLEQSLKDAQNELTNNKIKLSQTNAKLQFWQDDLKKSQQEIPLNTGSSSALIELKDNLKQAINNYNKQTRMAEEKMHTSEVNLKQGQTELNGIKNQLQKYSSQINKLNTNLTLRLDANDAPTNELSILKTWINEINQNKLSQLQKIITRYQQTKSLLSKNIEEIQNKLENVTQPNIESLQAKVDALQNQRTEAIKQTTSANNRFNDAQKILNKVQSILKEQGAFQKEYDAITNLYDVINGKGSDDTKLKLETFVVQNYLQQVLKYANDHFMNLLSSGRYTFMLSNDASDMRKDHGLDINVMDGDTGFVRPSDTLSGGETFIAALSIALSLSEVVQSSSNGVKIDALFIDEGFGSLDDETLDKAMLALDRIGQNRMVGVISHVESMKNDIGQQILITKLGNGRSRVKLVNK